MKIKVWRERKVSLYWPVGKLLLGFYRVCSPSGDSWEQWAAIEFYLFLHILSKCFQFVFLFFRRFVRATDRCWSTGTVDFCKLPSGIKHMFLAQLNWWNNEILSWHFRYLDCLDIAACLQCKESNVCCY